ncbi:TMEM165/GDT1 family protein [Pseudohongiella sp. O18]|uniref:TMEM165/GDT1 family protein n=1 Tax=unclassified Pseudohongiella TaxID=2629611 RepID=UPI0039833C4F
MMDAFLVSTGLVTLAEIGDRTQLLAFLLAARFRRPAPIILAILLATLANHGVAGLIGSWLNALLEPQALRWVLGVSFIAMAVWVLIPDSLEDTKTKTTSFGVFGTTFITFFLAEIGDKTQIATVALAAQYEALVWVVLGTTLGMMIANIPAVYVGDKLADRLPVRAIHIVAAIIFAALGIATLLGAGARLGI